MSQTLQFSQIGEALERIRLLEQIEKWILYHTRQNRLQYIGDKRAPSIETVLHGLSALLVEAYLELYEMMEISKDPVAIQLARNWQVEKFSGTTDHRANMLEQDDRQVLRRMAVHHMHYDPQNKVWFDPVAVEAEEYLRKRYGANWRMVADGEIPPYDPAD